MKRTDINLTVGAIKAGHAGHKRWMGTLTRKIRDPKALYYVVMVTRRNKYYRQCYNRKK